MVLRKGSGATVRASSGKKIPGTLVVGTLGIDCYEYTERCIKTLQSSFEKTIFVYIDNGSTDETLSLIEALAQKHKNPDIDKFLVINNGWIREEGKEPVRNNCVGRSWNQIVDTALDVEADKIIICNNDIEFGPLTVDGMAEAYDRLRKEDDTTVMVTAANMTKNASQLGRVRREWTYHEHPDFSCMMITPETIERVGRFAEHYKPAYFEDNDYHWRILLQGYKAFGTNWAPYCHIASRTRAAHPNLVTHENWRANKVLFFKTMIADDVDEEVARERYRYFIENCASSEEHPNWGDVQEFCIGMQFIDNDFVDRVDNMDIWNVPMDNYMRGALSNKDEK